MPRLIKNIIRPGISPQLLIRCTEVSLIIFLAITIVNLADSLGLFRSGDNVSIIKNNDSIIPEQHNGIMVNSIQPSTALRDLFGKTANSDGERKIIEEPIGETKLNLILKGILADRTSDKKFALIALEGEDENIYRIGERVLGAELIHIDSRRVILRRNGVYESLTLKTIESQTLAATNVQSASNIKLSNGSNQINNKNQRTVSKTVLDQHLNDLPQLLKQAKTVPYTNNGQQAGFRVVEINESSLFNQLGLKRNDIIQAVNGISINNTKEALQAYQELKNAKAFQVDILRGGHDFTINYSIQ